LRFDPLAWPGAKTLCVAADGAHLLLHTSDGRTHRLWLPDGLPEPSTPLVAVFELDAYGRERGAAAVAFWRDVLALGRPDRRGSPPKRQAVVRGDAMHRIEILRAFDGDQAGATPREIAEVLFGAERVAENGPWKQNSFRYKVLHLIKTGQALVSGGYRRLLKPPKQRSGR